MEIGLTMPTHGLLARDERDATLQRLDAAEMRPLEVARLAERLGYHSLWFSDHVVMERTTDVAHPSNESGTRVYPDRPAMLDVPTTIAAVAAVTERVRLAPSVLIAPYRHPLNVAHQFATIDVLSRGRVLMGVGSGWERGEFEALGASYERRGPVTEECVELWKAAWTQEWISHEGRFFRVREVSMEPKPVQKPHPPIVYGAVTAPGARRAARCADALYPMFLEPYGEPERFEPLRGEALREAERVGRDLSGFGLYAFASALPTAQPQPEPRRTLTGSAEQILGDLERFARARYSLVNVHLEVPSGTMGEYLELVERFAVEILPHAARIEARPFA